MLFDDLYKVRAHEKLAFALGHWLGVTKLPHGERRLIAEYEARGEGTHARVYCVATPVRFYDVVVAPSDSHEGFTLSTGPGAHELAARLALAFAEGALTLSWEVDDER